MDIDKVSVRFVSVSINEVFAKMRLVPKMSCACTVCSFGAEVFCFGACEGGRRWFEFGEAGFGGSLG